MPTTPGQGQEIRDCPGDSLFAHARIFQISEYPSNLPCNDDVNILIVNYNNKVNKTFSKNVQGCRDGSAKNHSN